MNCSDNQERFWSLKLYILGYIDVLIQVVLLVCLDLASRVRYWTHVFCLKRTQTTPFLVSVYRADTKGPAQTMVVKSKHQYDQHIMRAVWCRPILI